MVNKCESVTLLFGLPVTFEEFSARIEGNSDFLGKWQSMAEALDERASDHASVWVDEYEPNVAHHLMEVQECAQRLGCRVVCGATLTDFRSIEMDTSVVILVTHWKDYQIANGDFLDDFTSAAVEARLAAIEDPFAESIRDQMFRNDHAWRPIPSLKATRDIIRKSVSWRSREMRQRRLRHIEKAETTGARRREKLDRWLHDLLKPGNCFELFDGLHGPQGLARAIPQHFGGVMDLTMCTSTWLGDYLGNNSGQRWRTVQFEKPQELIDAGLRLQLTLRFFSESSCDYQDCRLIVAREYDIALRKMRNK